LKMGNLFSMLLLPPIFRAFIALLFSGVAFPVAGVMVIRQNMLPLRYTLMHGLLLGGAISLALNLPSLPCYVSTCLIVVVVIIALGGRKGMDKGVSSSVMMVLSVALASAICHKAGVPSKDTLELLWGSPFTISVMELVFLILLSFILILYTCVFFRKILLLFFDKDIAKSQDNRIFIHEAVMVILISLAASLSMRFVGALLLDALLILPVVVALKISNGVKELFVKSSLIGFFASATGFIASLAFDIPPSAAISLMAVIIYFIIPERRKQK